MFPYAPQSTPPPEPPEEEEPTVGEMDDLQLIMSDSVLRWRAVNFADMGFSAVHARMLALSRPPVDVHDVRGMIEQGCAPDLAFKIVFP